MGTTYTVKFHGEGKNHNQIKNIIDEYLIGFNEVFSTYITNSEISLINQSDAITRKKGIVVSTEFLTVLTSAMTIYQQSKGNFEPTVYPLVELWEIALRNHSNSINIPSEKEIKEAKRLVGMNRVSLKNDILYLEPGITLDFSAIAKGSAVDGVADIMKDNDFYNYMIEIGGEVKVHGFNEAGTPWKILISEPFNKDISLAKKPENQKIILSLTNASVATSGDYLNYFTYRGQRYSHLFSPLTGKPIRHNITSVSVVLSDCESADAWATALIVMGQDGIEFSERNHIPAIFMQVDNNSQIKVIQNSWIDKYIK